MQQIMSANRSFNQYNNKSMIHVNKIYKSFISKSLKKDFINEFKNTKSYYFKKNYNNLKKIARSYKSMFFFFSYTDKLFRQMPMYPIKFFSRKSMKTQIRFYRLYFVFRPY
jgi:hypothetical protein